MKVAVIGAGTMGSGIAQTFAQADFVDTVYLCDIKQEFADGGFAKIKKGLDKMVSKGKMEQAAEDKVLAKFKMGLSSQCVDADLIVEAALENMKIKKDTFKELQENVVKNDKCIYATNTSSLSITEIGAGLKYPVVGMHFFNPAPVMKLIEVIAGINTPKAIVDEVVDISKKIGKTPVQVNESAGFVVNRILIPLINEGIFVYSEGVADIQGVDNAMKLGCNHPMGPLELGDLVGLDVVLAIMEVLYNETGDSKYRPAPLLRKMVHGGKLGVKSGVGFYNYADGGKVPVDQQ